MIEVWKPVKGYEEIYEVSNAGKVKALGIEKLFGNRIQNRGDKILRPAIKKTGYHQVLLCLNKTKRYMGIHQLVAIMFIPNPQNKPTVNHKDGDKANNVIGNLEWATNKEQINHADDTGLRNVKGESSKLSKLTNDAILDIRVNAIPAKELAKKYSVNRSCIYKVRNNETWRHV